MMSIAKLCGLKGSQTIHYWLKKYEIHTRSVKEVNKLRTLSKEIIKEHKIVREKKWREKNPEKIKQYNHNRHKIYMEHRGQKRQYIEGGQDLTGLKFGKLLVIKREYPDIKYKWLCKCECGKEKVISGYGLKYDDIKSCGCLRKEIAKKKREAKSLDMVGKKFGRLTVINKDYSQNKYLKYPYLLCRCECGTEKIINKSALMAGHTRSCGCLNKENVKKWAEGNKLAFGLSNKRSVIRIYKKMAKKRGYIFNLSDEQSINIMQQDCYYCGAKPNNISTSKRSFGDFIYNGIDRVDNERDYTIDNVVSCCKICNIAKNNLTLQEFQDWIKRVYNKIFDHRGLNIKEVNYNA